MTTMTSEQPWRQLAGQTRQRLNLAWWWQSAAPSVSLLAGVGAAVVVYLRATVRTFPVAWAAGGLLLGVVLTMLGAWAWARRHFVTTEDGLVQLEVHHGLQNALTSAAAGVGAWPALPVVDGPVGDGLRWRGTHVMLPLAVIIGTLGLALAWPIYPPAEVPSSTIPPPSATQETERLLQALAQGEAAREQDLAQFKKALDSLQKQAPEQWYSHSSLEAADHLHDSLHKAASDLSRNYQKAARSLEKLTEAAAEGAKVERQQAAQELKTALEGLKTGGLQPNEALLKKLQALDPAGLQQALDPAAMKELKEALKANAQALQDALKQPGGESQSDEEKALREALKNGVPGEDDQQGEGEGTGEPERGPGTVDLKLNRKIHDLETNRPEKEPTHDFKRLAPGELLGTTDGEHAVDRTAADPSTSQGPTATGSGGDAVRKESLLPEEKQVLRKYFK